MNRELLNELKEFLAERMVDNMSTEQLAEYVQDDLFQYFDKQGEHDFLEEAENYWGEHLGEVIDEIQDYMKCDFKKDKRSGWIPPWGGDSPMLSFVSVCSFISLMGIFSTIIKEYKRNSFNWLCNSFT